MHPNPSAYAGTTPAAIRPAKPSRYARVYPHLAQARNTRSERPAFHRMEPAGAERHGRAGRDRVSGSERVKRPTTIR